MKAQHKTWAQRYGARAAKMYKAGRSVPEIAAHFGDRLQQNKIRRALYALGVYEYQSGPKSRRKTRKNSPKK